MDPLTVGVFGVAAVGLVAANAGTAAATVEKEPVRVDPGTLSTYDDGEYQNMTSNTAVKTIHMSKKGIASTKPITVMEALKRAVKYNGDKHMLRFEENIPDYVKGVKPPMSAPVEQWRSLSYRQFYEQVRLTARALIHLGMEYRSGVAIWGFNAVPWHVTMLAAAFGGGITAGLYTTDTSDQVKYKLEYTSCTIAVVETNKHADKILSVAADLNFLKTIIVWAPEGPLPTHKTVKIYNFNDLSTFSSKVPDSDLVKMEETIQPGSVFIYTFTSGTTGQPKAALITHDNILFTTRSMIARVQNDDESGLFCSGQERMISYLPLSHIAGTLLDIMASITLASVSPMSWITVHFARPYDLKASTIVERFQVVKPTIFFGVPRVWEKIMEKMQATVAANPLTGVKLKLAKWALGRSIDHQQNRQHGGNGAKGFGFGIAQKLILDKVRNALGLVDCKFFVSAAAPLSVETMEFFGARGINVIEAYGMTESCGATTAGTTVCHQWGTVGFAIEGVEVMIQDSQGNACPRATDPSSPEDAAQGEVCIRGRSVCAGYLANPKLGKEHVEMMIKKTNESVDSSGWLHTGDMGIMTTSGFFKITGRYKELIIGAGGENIAPVPIENEIKRQCSAISNVMMVGDKRKFNVALITLKVVGATGELAGTNELDVAFTKDFVSPGTTTVESACKDDALIASITKAITSTNSNGAVTLINAAKIQKFTILPTEFSIEGGELTPSMKLKRHTVNKMYGAHIDAMYASNATYVPFPLSRL